MIKQSFYLFLLFVSLSFRALSQSYYFKNYSVDEGLPFIQVYTIYQDSKGYLWLGGYGGLSKFDGKSFVNFSPKDGLVNHSVTSIKEDKHGNLWIGTVDGLSVYDGQKFKNYTTENGLAGNYVNFLNTDTNGVMYIGTSSGISMYNGKTFVNYYAKDGLLSDNVLTVSNFPDGSYWLGTDKGASLLKNGKYTNYSIKEGLSDSVVSSITQGANGEVWIGTRKGVNILSNGTITQLHVKDGLPDEEVTSILNSGDGSIWIATLKGVCEVYNGKIRTFDIGRNKSSNEAGPLYLDREKNIWIGTHNGLYKYRSAAFVSYTQHDGLNSNLIFQTLRDKKGDLLICTGSDGLYVMKGKSFSKFTMKDGLPSDNVMSIVEDDRGRKWLGTASGICMFDGKKFTNFKNSASGKMSIIVYKDSKGRIWGGSVGSVVLFDPVTLKSITHTFGQGDIGAIKEDSKGNIWLGAYQGGIYKYDGRSFKEMNDELEISSRSCMAIDIDKNGNIYFGTFGGVYIYNGVKTVNISLTDGLSSDLVYLVMLDNNDKDLWVGSNQGLNKIVLEDYYNTGEKKVLAYGKEEGFTGVECNSNSVFKDRDGTMWFGTVNGLIHYFPSNYKPNLQESKINIREIRLFYRDTLLAPNSTLEYYNNNISFRYVGICLTNPSKVFYQYKLEGFDKNWSPITTEDLAAYSNLPPGNYTFKIKASNNEGIWNAAPYSFKFKIERPFWKTWWFWTSLALLLGCIIMIIFYLRVRAIKRREHIIMKRNVEMAEMEMKALRSQMNPHFIFNSLNAIQHFILKSDAPSASKYLNKFAKLIRMILNNSEKSTVSIREEIDALKLYLELEQLRFENKFDYKVEIEDGLDTDYFEIPAMLLQPYVENAVLHGLNPKEGKGLLQVKIQMDKQHIICSVIDNGIGRKQSELLKHDRLQKHESLGTKITNTRLELLNRIHNSEMNVVVQDLYSTDNKPEGTRVDVYVPIA